MAVRHVVLCALPVMAAACQAAPPPVAGGPVAAIGHDGVETRPLGADIVNLTLRMSGPATEDDLLAYAECAAAGHALLQGYGFARHVRTNVQIEGSLRVADAIYTMSPTLPRGLQTIDAEVMASSCAEQGIPTV